jgi:hypothetical protein
MSRLNLPAGAEQGFRLVVWDAFGGRFTANLYGARRDGWLLASRRDWFGVTSAVGPVSLVRPKWREFLGLIKQAGFWELPDRLSPDPDVVTDDGEWLLLAGRRGDRYHEVHREGCGSPGLFQVQRFVTRWSGLLPTPRPWHPTQGLALDAYMAGEAGRGLTPPGPSDWPSA